MTAADSKPRILLVESDLSRANEIKSLLSFINYEVDLIIETSITPEDLNRDYFAMMLGQCDINIDCTDLITRFDTSDLLLPIIVYSHDEKEFN